MASPAARLARAWNPRPGGEATRIVKVDKPFSYDIDPLIPLRHPQDDGVWLGNVIGVTAHTNERICVSRIQTLSLPGLRPSPTTHAAGLVCLGVPVEWGETVTGMPGPVYETA